MTRISRDFLAIFVIFLAGSAPDIFAATLHVPSQYPSIQSGIEAAASGDTVFISCGTYFEHDIIMKGGITLLGESPDPGCVVIDAEGLGRGLDCVDLGLPSRLENLNFTGGSVLDGWFTALGGGVRCLNSDLEVINCGFRNNSSRIGAGFGASESSITMVNCDFDSNIATHINWAGGGGLWARDCNGTIDSCRVTGNTAFSENPGDPGDGGGFFFNNSRLHVSNGFFQGNSTGAGAGALYTVSNDSSIVTNCEFIDNVAANGGAVYLETEVTTQLIGCRFTGNLATAGGAVVSFNQSSPKLIDCYFSGNVASEWGGGAVDAWQSQLEISGCTFLANSAQTHGGAANFGGCTVDLQNSVFAENTTQLNGGALRAHYSNIQVTGCTLVGNSAAQGGGIFSGAASTVDLDRSIIAFSPMGESLAGMEPGFATVSCCDFFGNTGGDWVGEIADLLLTEGNFASDPLFCNIAEGDFTLSANSPCSPEVPDGCGLIGALPIGCGVSAIPDSPLPEMAITGVRAYPNPFNPSTTLNFTLEKAGSTRVAVYDLAGTLVRTLLAEELPTGDHEIKWLGRDNQGRQAASGIYLYRIESGAHHTGGRLTLIK